MFLFLFKKTSVVKNSTQNPKMILRTRRKSDFSFNVSIFRILTTFFVSRKKEKKKKHKKMFALTNLSFSCIITRQSHISVFPEFRKEKQKEF